MRVRLLTLFLTFAAAVSPPALAQAPVPTKLPPNKSQGHQRDFSFVVMPVPISDPMLGNGLAGGAVLFYKVGGSKRPWITGVGGLYTDTESYALAAFQRADFADDRVRVAAGAGGGVFNVEFFGVGSAAGRRGISVPIKQEAYGGLAKGMVRVAPHTYVGGQYRYLSMTTTIRIENLPLPDLEIPQRELQSATGSLGLTGEYDSRDDEFQPGKGLYATGTWMQAAENFGSDFDYGRVEATVNGYHRRGEKSVWAWRGSACWSGDGAPFYDICNYGMSNDLRGYPAGQYRDHALFAAQVEYRRRLFGRFGAVAFAGVGAVAPDFGELGEDLLPGAGIGLRWQASKKYGVNVSIDYAVGKDSDALYFYVGEAF